ncbi:chromosome segregation protein SMC [Verrucomicrobiales bacterium]|jgi:chromosome segregation protein|nr:chromosome segregation protein SMC [Verrucomicrobiales bacterium]
MRLKSLFLHGFKSFADGTEFAFHPGVTAIVGPNGCGKSNVVDGIRWVLGETSAKALRGGEMADVIFSGTDKRKPLGMAEVTLTFADCEEALNVDFNEVSLTRRVFRDGKSEYRINDKLCRLKDIQSLLMDTGIGRTAYSIMEQGKIDMLLSSKPEDRRNVFEEAAGITKFKIQKREALRKLDYTESNLVRVSDIMTELSRQRDSLQRQANKARRYRELLDDLTTLDTHFTHRQFRELAAERAELKNSIESLEKQEESCRAEIEGKSGSLSGQRERLECLETEFHELSQQQMTLRSRIQNSQGRLGFNKERTVELNQYIEQNQMAIEDTVAKLAAQENALAQAEESLTEIVTKLDSQRNELNTAEQSDREVRQKRADIQMRLTKAQNQRQQLISQLANLEASHASKLERRENEGQRMAVLEEESAGLIAERGQFDGDVTQFAASIKDEAKSLEACEVQRKSLEERVRGLRSEQEEKRVRLREVERAMSSTRSRLDVVQKWVEQGEGFEKGTQSVLKGLDDPETYKNSVRGVLGTLINVNDDKYMSAVEAALREHLQTVLVANGTVAESMIDRLSEKQLGYASILPGDGKPLAAVARPVISADGVTAVLDVVKVDDKIKPWVSEALANVFIVDSVPRARALQPEHVGSAFVTLGGESVSASGVIHGGSTRQTKDSILQKQAEIQKLKDRFVSQEKEQEEAQRAVTKLEEALKGTQAEREELQETTQQHKLNRSRMEDQRRMVTMELQRVAGRESKLNREKEELARRQESLMADVERLANEQKEKQQAMEAIQQDLNQAESDMNTLEEEEASSSERVNALRTRLAVEEQTEQSLRNQRNPMAGRLEELTELQVRHQSEIEGHQERLAAIETENTELTQVVSQSEAEVAEVDEKLLASSDSRKAAQQEVRELEDLLAQKNQERSTVQEQRGREEVRTTQLDLRVESITASITERYQVEIENFRPDAHQLLLALESQKARNRRSRSNKIEESVVTEAPVGDSDADVEVDPETGEFVEAAEPDWGFIEASVKEMRRKLDSMGPVNLDAIQEFEETEERLQFLTEQHADLTNSKEELLRVLAKINTESRKQFAETFIKVRDNFKMMFRELFGESAKADLILLDEDDPLESGIDIIAKPPGKKLQTISLLSGGERSMTAVALLFAIYMVKPSPFCVLDELDAPLDEANIARFVKMLDRFITQSQFVIITHSKRTMNRADVMYGVTMQEFGVSKPVGMKLTQDDKPTNPELAELGPAGH